MRTAEFEVSLFLVLKVCGNTVERIKKKHEGTKHTISTKSFIAEYRGGRLDKDGACKDDYPTWANS